MVDVDQLRIRYAQMPDARLEQIAYEEAAGLTPEALEVIREELRRRGRAEALAPIEAQTIEMTTNDIELLVDAVRECPCPMCGKRSEKLNAVEIAETTSFLLITSYEKRVELGCPPCISVVAKQSTKKTALLGWWAFPWGPIRTIQALFINMNAIGEAGQAEATDALWKMVEERPGVMVGLIQESAR